MGRKAKFSYEDKLKACEDYINGIASVSQIAEKLKANERVVQRWINKYRMNGPESLMPKLKNSSYTKEFKIKAVEDYLSGGGSQEEICNKYQITDRCVLRRWIAKYNDLKELEDYIPKPEVYTKMAYRKTTLEVRSLINAVSAKMNLNSQKLRNCSVRTRSWRRESGNLRWRLYC